MTDSEAQDEVRYCVCRKTEEAGGVMIGCGVCEDWFHQPCLHLYVCKVPTHTNQSANKLCYYTLTKEHIDVSEEYVCPGCSGLPSGAGGKEAVKAAQVRLQGLEEVEKQRKERMEKEMVEAEARYKLEEEANGNAEET